MNKFAYFVISLLFISLVSFGASDVPEEPLEDIFLIDYTLNLNDSVVIHEFSIKRGVPTITESTPPGNFTLQLIGNKGEKLLVSDITFGLVTYIEKLVPCEEIGEPYPGEMCMTGEEVFLNSTTRIVRVPYYSNVEVLEFLHNEKVIFSLNITNHLCNPNFMDEKCLDFCKGKGDPDCKLIEKEEKCRNNVCDSGENDPKSEFYCPQDCKKPEKCGNNKCEVGLGENFKSCSKDCPSGSKDGYCDEIREGKCDPDCIEQGLAEKDNDCKIKKKIPLWIYVFIGLFILIILFVIFMSVKVKRV